MTTTLWVNGAPCWTRDNERAFVEATFVEYAGTAHATVCLLVEGERRKCRVEDLLPRSAIEQGCVAEMEQLQELNTATVLNNVELLYGQRQSALPGDGPNTIYSSVGPVLIAMNPFTELPLYGKEWITAYRDAGSDPSHNQRLGPHCYRTAEEAYSRLRRSAHKSQSVVICGESGAGKTVTNKRMLEYLCAVAGKQGAKHGVDPERITEANVLLEAFGNARTTRNGNSSRFGKYTRLLCDPETNHSIVGCSVDHYLLERSRVVAQPPKESNFHIFYQLLKSSKGRELGLRGGPEDYAYTKSATFLEDHNGFETLHCGMVKAGFSETQCANIFTLVAAVLVLGNVDFEGGHDTSKVSSRSSAALEQACSLLGVDSKEFGRALTSNVIRPPTGAPITTEVGIETARAQRDAVSKTIYSRLFDHIVSCVSNNLRRGGGEGGDPDAENSSRCSTIGLLDIFGFEDMPVNGLEQMLINLTNERIQHLFNNIMFERELEAYKKEGITAAFNPGTGNLDCVRLFTSPANPPGIVKLLGESALIKSGRDGAAFVQVLNSSFARHGNYKVCDPQDAQRAARTKNLQGGSRVFSLDYRECFQVRHYAGTVMYTVQAWVPKSTDVLLPHLSSVLGSAKESRTRQLFEKEAVLQQGSATSEKATLGEKFCSQLEALAGMLEQGGILFVRCIKSNPQMIPGLVDRNLVLEQLTYGGVISALQMRQRGLPERMGFLAFAQEFSALASKSKDFPATSKTAPDEGRCRRASEHVLQSVFNVAGSDPSQLYAMGHTKVFMKGHVATFLRTATSLRQRNQAKLIQRRWRLHMGTERIRQVEEAEHRFQLAAQQATSRAIKDVPSVRHQLQIGKEKTGAAADLLRAARARHGGDVARVAAALPGPQVLALYGVVEAVEEVVERITHRKATVERLFGLCLTRAMDNVRRLLERIAVLECECAEVADLIDAADCERCKKACHISRTYLAELQMQALPDLKKKGPIGVDLDCDDDSLTETNISSEVKGLMETAEKQVEEAESQGHTVLRVKRLFQEAVKEVKGTHDASQKKLESLQEDIKQCVAAGLDGVGEKVNLAWQRWAEAQEVMRESKDAQGYRDSVKTFATAVQEAETAAARGREELKRREEEKEERRVLQTQLSTTKGKLSERRSQLLKALEVRMSHTPGAKTILSEVDGLLEQEIPTYLRPCAQVPEHQAWRKKVADINLRAEAAVTSIDAHLAQTTKARQEEFARRMNAFIQTPDRGRNAGRAEEEVLEPKALISAEGLAKHEPDMLQIEEALRRLQEAGAPQSGVRRCVQQWLRQGWHCGTSGASHLQSSPGQSPTRW